MHTLIRFPLTSPPAPAAAALCCSSPAGIAQLPRLSEALLGDNGLSGALPQRWTAPQLERLELQNNQLSGAVRWSWGDGGCGGCGGRARCGGRGTKEGVS